MIKLVYIVVLGAVAYAGYNADPHPPVTEMQRFGSTLFFMAIASILVSIYLIPAIVARARGHSNATGIAIFNIFLGWTFVSWIWALIAACANAPSGHMVVEHVHHGRIDHIPQGNGPQGNGPWDRPRRTVSYE